MRTQEEILNKIKQVEEEDWMGTIRSDLVCYLEYDNAKQFLKDCTEEEWNEDMKHSDEDAIESMRSYLDFAYGKAHGGRGISAGRSMDHYTAWIWLIGEEERFGDIRMYENYGLSHLDKIAEFLGEPKQL